jgi:hypothetical protein
MIFDRIISSPREMLCNLCPFIPNLSLNLTSSRGKARGEGSVDLQENHFLLFRPLVLRNCWIKLIVPSLTALLSTSPI